MNNSITMVDDFSYAYCDDVIESTWRNSKECIILDIISSILILYAASNFIYFTYKRDGKLKIVSTALDVQRQFNSSAKTDLYSMSKYINRMNDEVYKNKRETRKIYIEFNKLNNSVTLKLDDFELIIKRKFKNMNKRIRQIEKQIKQYEAEYEIENEPDKETDENNEES